MDVQRWAQWLREAFHRQPRRGPRYYRPQVMALEDRRVLSTALFQAPTIDAYAGVGFQANTVAELNGVFNGQQNLNINDYTVVVNWEDGTPVTYAALGYNQNAGGLISADPILVKASHIYATPETYIPLVEAIGPDGVAAITQSTIVNVTTMPSGLPGSAPTPSTPSRAPSNVGLQIYNAGPVYSYAGVGFQQNVLASFNGTLNGLQDTTLTDYTAQVNWGDSSQWQTASLAVNQSSANPFLVKGSHIYATPGTYDVVIYLQGPDGTSWELPSLPTTTVTVTAMPNSIPGIAPNPIPPSLKASNVGLQLYSAGNILAYAGVGFQENTLAGFSGTLNGQPDLTLSDYTAQVNWGDSSAWQTAILALNSGGSSSAAGGLFLVKGSHIYAAAGTYDIVIFIQGPDGTSTSMVLPSVPNTTTVTVTALPSGIPGSAPAPLAPSLPPSNVMVNQFSAPSFTATADGSTGMQAVALFKGTLNGQPDLTASDYHAQINWGDSSAWVPASVVASNSYPPATFLVEGSHTYAALGTYSVVVFLQGPDGTSEVLPSTTTQVFVTGIVQAVSLRAANQVALGNSYAASTSADGRYSVFTSSSSNVILNQHTMNATENVFVYDNVNNTTMLVNHIPGLYTTTGNGGVGFAPSSPFTTRPPAWLTPVISADGSTIAFASLDSNLLPGESMSGSPGGEYFLYLYNVATGALSLVNHLPGQPINISASALYPSISANGQDVAYIAGNTSSATGYVPVSTNRYDRGADASTVLATATPAGTVTASGPVISDNGLEVAYVNNGNVYVWNNGATALVNHNFSSLTTPANSSGNEAVLSHDGSTIAFISAATDLVSGQAAGTVTNVFRYGVTGGIVSLVSGSIATPANGNSDSPAIDDNGSYLAFRSDATNLLPGQSGAAGNIFEVSQAGTIALVSAQVNTSTTGAGSSSEPVIDGDGHLVSYVSTASNLVPGQTGTPGVKNIFIWLRQTAANFLASGQQGSASAGGNADSDGPLLTRDSFPGFSSTATNLLPGSLSGVTNGNSVAYYNLLVHLQLSVNAIAPNSPAGTLVGTLGITGSFYAGAYLAPTFTLDGSDADNASFSLNANGGATTSLYTAVPANYAVKSSFQLTVDFNIGFGEETDAVTVNVTPPPPPPPSPPSPPPPPLPPASLPFLGTAGNGTVVAHLTGAGVWRFENGIGWQQLTATNATQVGVDANGDVVALLTGAGVWRWEDAHGWQQLTASTALEVGIAGNGIVTALFVNAGVWRWEDGGGWQQLTASAATQVGVDANGDVVAALQGAGLWRWKDAGGWVQLTTNTPLQVAIAGNGIVVATFQGAGVWRWEDPLGWRLLTSTNAAGVGVDAAGDVAAALAGAGVWRWVDGSGWQLLTASNASQLGIGGNGNVVAELPGLGLWRFENGVGWQLLTSTNAG